MTSGGKDSTLALDRVRRDGLEVRFLVNVYEGTTQRVRFHGVRHRLIQLQAEAFGLELLQASTHPQDFEAVFLGLLDQLKQRDVQGVVFGNVHLEDVRAWYEDRVTAAGLEHIEPLWGSPAIEVAWEAVERGYHPLVVSVDLNRPAARFLGREFDADLVTEIGVTEDLDPCGERGEYHTFVYDGPAFADPISFTVGEQLEIEGHAFLDLVPSDSANAGE